MMSLEDAGIGVSVDFLVGEKSVPVPVLNGFLASLQQAIYVVGAYDTGKERLRGASRQRYTLAVSDAHHSDLHFLLVPVALQTIEQLSLFGTIGLNVASSALYDAAKFAITRIKDHYSGRHPERSDAGDAGLLTSEDLRDQGLWQASCRSAVEVAKLGGSVRTSLRSRDGTDLSFEATPEAATHIIETDLISRGKAHRYRNCEVIRVAIPGPILHARIPDYRNAVVHCVCDASVSTMVETQVRLSHFYTIVGTPVWARNRTQQSKPSSIDVITLEGIHGEVILASDLDQQEYQSHATSTDDGGLFTTGQEDTK